MSSDGEAVGPVPLHARLVGMEHDVALMAGTVAVARKNGLVHLTL